MSSPSPAAIPSSKTWSVLSTIQKLPTDHNVSSLSTNSRPITIPSTIQSTVGSLPPHHAVTHRGRTSISRLGKPTSIRSYLQRQQKVSDPRTAQPLDGSVEQPNNHSQPQEAFREKPRSQTLFQDQESPSNSKMLQVNKRIRVYRREPVTLRTPIWGTENDRAGAETGVSGFLRRSKRFQQLKIKSLRNGNTPEPTSNTSEPLDDDDDDVSPTTTPGQATPRWKSPPMESNTQGLASEISSPSSDVSALEKALEAKLIEAGQADSMSDSKDIPEKGLPTTKPPTHDAVPKNRFNSSKERFLDGPAQKKTTSTSCNLMDTQDTIFHAPSATSAIKGANSKQHSRNGSEEHLEGLATCSLLPNRFRRNSSAVQGKTKRMRSKSNDSSSEGGEPNNKKRSFAWIPKRLRRMSVHRSKNRNHSHASTDEGTLPTSEARKEFLAKHSISNRIDQLSLGALESRRNEPDTASFTTPSSSKSKSRPH